MKIRGGAVLSLGVSLISFVKASLSSSVDVAFETVNAKATETVAAQVVETSSFNWPYVALGVLILVIVGYFIFSRKSKKVKKVKHVSKKSIKKKVKRKK